MGFCHEKLCSAEIHHQLVVARTSLESCSLGCNEPIWSICHIIFQTFMIVSMLAPYDSLTLKVSFFWYLDAWVTYLSHCFHGLYLQVFCLNSGSTSKLYNSVYPVQYADPGTGTWESFFYFFQTTTISLELKTFKGLFFFWTLKIILNGSDSLLKNCNIFDSLYTWCISRILWKIQNSGEVVHYAKCDTGRHWEETMHEKIWEFTKS